MIERGSGQQNDFEAPKMPQQEEPLTQPSRFRDVVNFVRVSPAQQLLAAINFASAATPGVGAMEKASEGNYQAAAGLAAISLLNLAFLGFNEALAVGKLSEYKKIKAALSTHGWDERIIEPKSHSWCQRNAARVAAIDTGYKEEIDNYYEKEGYKWYHIIPYTKSR